MERRKFIKTTGSVALITCVCGVGIHSCAMIKGTSTMPVAPEASFLREDTLIRIRLDLIPDLKTPGASVKLNSDLYKIAIVHVSDDQFIALENRCTHGGRELNYLAETQKIQCSSFGHSRYNLKGEVEKGPAPRPLTFYPVYLEENELIVELG